MTAPLKTALWMVPLTLLASMDAGAGEIRAIIQNVKPNQGAVMVALYDSDEGYRADRLRVGQVLAAAGTEAVAVFTGLPAGRYGVAVYQDTDGNGALNKNMLGIPTEPYGFGLRGPAPRRPPSFEEFALTVTTDGVTATEVQLTK